MWLQKHKNPKAITTTGKPFQAVFVFFSPATRCKLLKASSVQLEFPEQTSHKEGAEGHVH